ncbi:hypothetical protein ACFLVS_04325 [Chloroflexota bacterium]
METFCCKTHLPGAGEEWNVVMEIDWGEKEVSVHIDEASGGISD